MAWSDNWYNYGYELGVYDWEKNQKMLPLEAKPLWLQFVQCALFIVQKSDPLCEFVKIHQYHVKMKTCTKCNNNNYYKSGAIALQLISWLLQ